MAICIILPIAVISTALCVFLWFREVRRILREQQSTVESAARQLTVCQEAARRAQASPETVAILSRSEDIYQQAVAIYNRTLQNPLYRLPANLMGFFSIS